MDIRRLRIFLFTIFIILAISKGDNGANCSMNDGTVLFCDKGCCEHQNYRYCCPLNASTIAEIIVGSAVGVGLLIFAIGVCVVCSRGRAHGNKMATVFDVNADYQKLMDRERNEGTQQPNTYM